MAFTSVQILSPVEQALAAVEGPSLAVMLYGSHARSTATERSDVDVLQLVATRPRTYAAGVVNVAAYRPTHLHALALSGSLFIQHLRSEGRVLSDPHGVLQRALSAYQPPASYRPLVAELSIAASALDLPSTELLRYSAGLVRLGVYLVRTAGYVVAAERGILTFDPEELSSRLGDPDLAAALALRNDSSPGLGDIATLRSVARRYLPTPRLAARSLLGLAITAQKNHRHAGDLLAGVLIGRHGVGYTHLSLPPT